jgi:hypothetical protein
MGINFDDFRRRRRTASAIFIDDMIDRRDLLRGKRVAKEREPVCDRRVAT